MRRLIGLFLLAVGLVLLAVGLFFVMAFHFAPAGQLGGGARVLGIVIFLLGGVALIVAGVLVMRGGRPIGSTTDGVNGYRANVTEARQVDGAEYEVLYQPPGKGRNPSPSSLVVRVPAIAPVTLRFNPRNWYDRMCMRLGIVPEQHTGDAEFDAAVYVRGPSRGYAEQSVENGDTRVSVLALLRHGFREVRLTGTCVEAAWSGFNPETNHRLDLTDDAAAELYFLADRMPPDDPDDELARPDRRFSWCMLLWLFDFAVAALVLCAFWYVPVRTWDLISAGLGLCAVAYPLFGLSAVLLLRGASTSHDRLAPLLIVGILLICLGSIGGIAAINALADKSPPERRTVPVLNKSSSTGRHGTSYYITVRGWNDWDERVQFSVSKVEYERIAPGRSELELTTGRGALGIEWVIDRRVRL